MLHSVINSFKHKKIIVIITHKNNDYIIHLIKNFVHHVSSNQQCITLLIDLCEDDFDIMNDMQNDIHINMYDDNYPHFYFFNNNNILIKKYRGNDMNIVVSFCENVFLCKVLDHLVCKVGDH